MLAILLRVVGISLSGVMMPGPMTAVAVAKSYRSPWAGAQIAIGHAIIEVPVILLIYFITGFEQFFRHPTAQLVFSVVGGAMLIWLGASMFRARGEVVHSGKDLPYSAVTAGILTSALNPFFLLWWATIGMKLIMEFRGFPTTGLVSFTLAHWLCDLGWLSLVSVLIYRTRRLWGRKVQQGLFIACSLLLIGFGGWFLVSGVQLGFRLLH